MNHAHEVADAMLQFGNQHFLPFFHAQPLFVFLMA